MLTDLATTRAKVMTDIRAWDDISNFADRVRGFVSAGAKLIALVIDKYK